MQGNILLKKLKLAQKIYEEYFLKKEFLLNSARTLVTLALVGC